MSNRLIYVECNPDELLVRKCGFTKRNIKHSYGKSNVGKLLEKNIGKLALVDEDPDGTPIPYFKNTDFTLVKQENGYTIKNDSRREHVIIEIKPNLEEWILDTCDEARVNIRTFNLPNNTRSLHHVINTNINKFERLLGELFNRDCRVVKLRDDLQSLRE